MSGGAKKLLHAAAGTAAAGGDKLYVEDVFSTFLYEGSGSTRSIDNGIALSDEGGLVWLKNRDANDSHALIDTINGPTKRLISNDSAAAQDLSDYFSFPSAGTTGFNLIDHGVNSSNQAWTSWTFRKAPGFFDIVQWTGTGADLTVAHDLGCVPGMILIKNTGGAHQWKVYHVGTDANDPQNKYLVLDDTNAVATGGNRYFQQTAPTATNFTVGNNADLNEDGETMVAYLFAGTGDSGSEIFGDDGDESIIKCGSFTTDGDATPADIDLGFEPQFFMYKPASITGNRSVGNIHLRGNPQTNENS